jgi:hypothetical protein
MTLKADGPREFREAFWRSHIVMQAIVFFCIFFTALSITKDLLEPLLGPSSLNGYVFAGGMTSIQLFWLRRKRRTTEP